MPPVLACLPELLDYGGLWPPLREVAYAVFRRDFFEQGVHDGDMRVMVNGAMHGDGREMGFHHLTTRDHGDGQNRHPDVDRTRRIHWIKPLVENSSNDVVGILAWRHLEGTGEVHRYYWAVEDNFVAICLEGKKSRSGRLILLSAFYVSFGPKRSDLEKKYKRRLR